MSPEFYLNEARDDGLTALGVAVRENSLLMVTLLVEAGADINFVDPDTNRSPIAEAIKMNNPEIVSYLLNLPQLDLRFKKEGAGASTGPEPFNALFYSIKKYDYNKVRILCKRATKLRRAEKAMVYVQNRQGFDPAYYALLLIEKLLRTFRTESEYFILDQAVAKQVNALVSIVKELIEFDTQFQNGVDFLKIERAYNREVEPGVTLLWKCVSLDQVALVEKLLTKLPGTGRPLADINQPDRRTA